MSFRPRTSVKGKFKGKGKGDARKGSAKGYSGLSEHAGETAPPLYTPEFIKCIPQPNYPLGKLDRDLVKHHRSLVWYWQTSCYRVEAPTSGSEGAAQRALQGRGLVAALDRQQQEITRHGGTTADYFPTELLLPAPLPARGKGGATGRDKNVLEALRKLEGRDRGDGEKGADVKDGDRDSDPGDDEANDVDDEDLGDDDDLAQYGEFEDGMGNDFDDDGGGDGGDEI